MSASFGPTLRNSWARVAMRLSTATTIKPIQTQSRSMTAPFACEVKAYHRRDATLILGNDDFRPLRDGRPIFTSRRADLSDPGRREDDFAGATRTNGIRHSTDFADPDIRGRIQWLFIAKEPGDKPEDERRPGETADHSQAHDDQDPEVGIAG